MATIYLMRHSQAAPSNFRTPDDARWLTAKGRAMAIDAGTALAEELGTMAVDTIVTSPLSRTVQTAELVARALDWRDEITCLSSLRSESSPTRAIDELEELPGQVIVAVTHEPIVSSMCALLVGKSADAVSGGFRPAEIACIGDGAVVWRYRP